MENLAGEVEEGIDEDVAKSLEDSSSVDAGTIDVGKSLDDATSVDTATIDGTEPTVMGLLLHEQAEAENGGEHCLDVELAVSADVDPAAIAGIHGRRLNSGPPTVIVTSHMAESNITVVDEKSGLHSMDQDEEGSDHDVGQEMSMEDDSQPESGRGEAGYTDNVQPVLELMSTGTTLVTGSQLMQAVSLPDLQGLQTMTLADGTTVLVQQNHHIKGIKQDHNMQLEEGVTAIVQEIPEDSKANITKMLEGQTIELEDGTTAFIQADPKLTDSLQAVQLEDGTTAYLSGLMTSDRILDNGNLNVEQLNAQVHQAIAGHNVHVSSGQLYLKTTDYLKPTGASMKTSGGNTISALPSSPRMPSDRALSLGDKAYRCQYEGCGRLYTTQHHLKVHERYHTGDRPYKCDFGDCEKAFATGYGLKSHTRVHTGEKPYKCPEDTCLKSFKTSGDLQKHIRTHTGERPFKCPFEGCERSFTTSNIRKVHIRTHTGERPYVCTEAGCNKTFASATNFKNHARIHTGEKPYVCTVQGCGKRFTEYSSLYKHHVVHTHSKPYECNSCGKTYRQTSTLAMHKRTTHGEEVSNEMGSALVMPADVTESGDGEHAKHSGLGLQGHDDGEGTLVINTSTGQQMNLVSAAGVGMAADAQTVAAIQHAAQHGIQGTLPPGQPGILAEVGGQQIFVVTDPMILEPLQQIVHHQGSHHVEIIPTVQDVPVEHIITNRQ